jgi:hypothetical protein
MEEILSKASAFPANATIIAVVNALIWIIIPQLAHVAIVPGSPLATSNAQLASSLCTSTDHTEHVFGSFPVQDVIFNLIMAQSTGVPSITG